MVVIVDALEEPISLYSMSGLQELHREHRFFRNFMGVEKLVVNMEQRRGECHDGMNY